MSRIRLAWLALGLCLGPVVFAIAARSGCNTATADEGTHKSTKGTKKQTADKQEKKSGNLDVNRLSMEFKALRALRNFEATPDQISEIARIAKNTVGTASKREPAKAAKAYIETLKQLRDALAKNDEQRIEALQQKLDGLEEKEPPDLDDEIDITDAAEIEVQHLLNMFSPQQVVAYADSLGDELPDPVQLIVDGIDDGRELKGDEWNSTRDEVAEKVSWLVCGLNGEKALKLEEDVSKFLDRKHSGTGKSNERESEIRKLIGSPGPVVLLNNVLEHDLAVLLSNPQLVQATKACLRHEGTQVAAAEKPVIQSAQKQKHVSQSPPSTGKSESSGDSSKSGKSRQPAAFAELDDVLKSPEKYDGRDLKFENVTITGTAPGRQEKFLWLEIKSGSGKVVPAARKGQPLTFIIAKADTPETIALMKPDTSVSATLICHFGSSNTGKHWDVRVRRIKVQAGK